jgi:hypothetical protein
MNSVQLTRHRFHEEWNYTIRPVTSPLITVAS